MNKAFKSNKKNITHKENSCKKKDITANLSVDYLGKHFENPFILSSGTYSRINQIKRAFEAGWAGTVITKLSHYLCDL